jgi:hypothetical protein
MLIGKRNPLDLLDQMYTIAYWMTGSLKKTNDLVYKTYDHIDSDSSEIELFKTFREVFDKDFSRENEPPPQNPSLNADTNIIQILRRERMDIKFSVLLAEICNLKHSAIALIMGRPLDTIRLWLTSGRKTLLEGMAFLLAILFCEPALAN